MGVGGRCGVKRGWQETGGLRFIVLRTIAILIGEQ